MIRGLIVLAFIAGAASFMVADIMRPDTGQTSAYVNSWPVEHPAYFGITVAVVVLVIGLLVVIASNSERDR